MSQRDHLSHELNPPEPEPGDGLTPEEIRILLKGVTSEPPGVFARCWQWITRLWRGNPLEREYEPPKLIGWISEPSTFPELLPWPDGRHRLRFQEKNDRIELLLDGPSLQQLGRDCLRTRDTEETKQGEKMNPTDTIPAEAIPVIPGVTREWTAAGETIRMAPATLQVLPRENGYALLVGEALGNKVEIWLDAAALQCMGQQCAALYPHIASEQPGSLEEAHRITARDVFREMGDRSIKIFLRELNWYAELETLTDFLWYMKDGELIRQILRNMNRINADLLMETLEYQRAGKNPDTAPDEEKRAGRAAVLSMLNLVRRLKNESQIV